MKNYLLVLCLLAILLVSCKDDEPEINPLIGTWELDDATLEFQSSGFSYSEFSGDNDVYGESSYIIQFFDDLTYEREINDIPGFGDINDEGEWEQDGEDIDLDSDDDEIGGVPYSFTLVEVNDRSLVLTYEEEQLVWSNSKLDEWFADGTINSSGQFNIETQDQLDSLLTFRQTVDAIVTLEFDRN